MRDDQALLDSMITAACEAGVNSLGVLEGTFRVDRKSDRSPVTRADTEADTIINRKLSSFGLPLVSEESPLPEHSRRMSWYRYLLIDPLDGTRGFVRGGREFAVNIALMQAHTPILGVIALPISGTVYFGGPQVSTCRLDEGFASILSDPHSVSHRARPAGFTARAGLNTRGRSQNSMAKSMENGRNNPIRVIASRHSLDESTGTWIHQLEANRSVGTGGIETMQAGSAAKFCMLADNEADVYPRFAPCMEWDTAAGVALVRGAGGEVYDAHSGLPLSYGDADWYSRPFIALSKSGVDRGIPTTSTAAER